MKIKHLFLVLFAIAFASCNGGDDSGNGGGSGSNSLPKGVYILNEGQMNEGNASISYYDPETGQILNNIFHNANGIPLGDIASAINVFNNKVYITINNSGKIFITDYDFKLTKKIIGLASPRTILFINSTKAYISNLYSDKIDIFNPSTDQITGQINLGSNSKGARCAENLIMVDGFIYANCWNLNNVIIKIDASTGNVVDQIEVGMQPANMVLDKNKNLWVLCDGGWNDDFSDKLEAPSLYKVSTGATMTAERIKTFPRYDWVHELTIDKNKSILYFVVGDIYTLNVSDPLGTLRSFIPANGRNIYGLGVNPNGEIYFSDALDYVQRGIVYRYSAANAKIDSVRAGVVPRIFYFNN